MSSGKSVNRFAIRLSPARRVALKPISAMAGSILTVLILVEATRRGQLPDIGGYTAGASIGALVSAVAGSGTSLAYLTGDATVQRGVRRVRHLVVAPAMLVSVLAASFLYDFTTQLTLAPILLGGLSVVLNNLAELDSASLERRLETPKLLIASGVSRSIGFVSLIAGLSFSGAMFVSSLSAYAMLRLFARPYTVTAGKPPRLGVSFKYAYAPSLMGLSVLGIVGTRAVLVVAPFFMSAEHSGALSSLVSAQQNVTAVLISALYTVMAAHSEAGSVQAWMHKVASRTTLLSGFVAVGAALGAPIVVSILSLGAVPDAGLWWILLGLAVLPYVYNRKSQYAFLGGGERSKAVLLLGVNAGCTLVVCGIAAGLKSTTLLAATFLISEAVTAFTLGVIRYRGSRVDGCFETRC